MAEVNAFDRPPTSETQMEFSNASNIVRTHPNVRIREFLKKECRPLANRSDLDVESSDDEQQRARDTRSPPPNCSICLSRVKNKCFTDSCMHQFCFSCLLEWSKVSERADVPVQ